MRFLSVCSGIEAASVAWHPLGWRAIAYSEIEAFPSAVLAHHYPGVPNLGDMTRFEEWPDADVDVLVGGTPCQSFSVAGLRKGLADPRGNLMLTFGAIARRYRPEWLVWENVPGVLSSNGGRDFGTFLGMLAELGYGFAYRVLDAQFFGVAQRRRRVFVVGCLGDWRRAAAVLFERHSLSGHPAPRREAGKDATGSTGDGVARCLITGEAKRQDWETCNFVAHSLRAEGFDASEDGDGAILVPMVAPTLQAGGNSTGGDRPPGTTVDTCDSLIVTHTLRGEGFDASEDGTGRDTPIVPVQPYTLAIRGRGDSHYLEYRQDGTANALLTPNGGRGWLGVGAIAFSCKDHGADAGEIAPVGFAWQAGGGKTASGAFAENLSPTLPKNQTMAVAFADCFNGTLTGDVAATMGTRGSSQNSSGPTLLSSMAVRRLTPRECERLQGFPDDYTLIPVRGKPAADGPRYKALGNSMAVPVMRWIGQRIAAVHALALDAGKVAA